MEQIKLILGCLFEYGEAMCVRNELQNLQHVNGVLLMQTSNHCVLSSL